MKTAIYTRVSTDNQADNGYGLEMQQTKCEAMATVKQKLTPPQVAALWGISPDKVVYWIQSGELRAIDASTNRGARPRYLIDRDDLADFEQSRLVASPTPKPMRQRPASPVKNYF